MRISDWSSDVCSSDLRAVRLVVSGVAVEVFEDAVVAVACHREFPGNGPWQVWRGLVSIPKTRRPARPRGPALRWCNASHNPPALRLGRARHAVGDRKSTRLNSSH